MTPYFQHLLSASEQIQPAIEDLLAQFHVLPVGTGYIDLIVPVNDALELVEQLAALSVAVNFVTWWCHCTPESTARLGCPHGMGGPIDPAGYGWFSECVGYPDLDVTDYGVLLDDAITTPQALAQACAQIVSSYLTQNFPFEPFYSPCLCPALWLYTPEQWQRKRYLVSE